VNIEMSERNAATSRGSQTMARSGVHAAPEACVQFPSYGSFV